MTKYQHWKPGANPGLGVTGRAAPRLPVWQGEHGNGIVAGGMYREGGDESWHADLAELVNIIGSMMRSIR